jgi:hypothetical protein
MTAELVCKLCGKVVHAFWHHPDWTRRVVPHQDDHGKPCPSSRQKVKEYCEGCVSNTMQHWSESVQQASCTLSDSREDE